MFPVVPLLTALLFTTALAAPQSTSSNGAAPAKIRYMPFGDSITEIVCWRGYLWRSLQSAGYTNVDFVGSQKTQNPNGCSFSSYDRDHEGHTGFKAVDIAKKGQLEGWLKKNPADIVTMHLGTNDITDKSSTATIIGAFTTLVKQMRASNPKMRIIVAKIIPAYQYADPMVKDLNTAIDSWAKGQNSTQSPLWVVDQYSGFPRSDLRDNVHPKESGDAKIAAKWFPALETAIKSLNGA